MKRTLAFILSIFMVLMLLPRYASAGEPASPAPAPAEKAVDPAESAGESASPAPAPAEKTAEPARAPAQADEPEATAEQPADPAAAAEADEDEEPEDAKEQPKESGEKGRFTNVPLEDLDRFFTE